MNKIIIALLLVLITTTVGFAAESGTASELKIDLPSSSKVEARDDMAAGIFSQILGPAWVLVCGDNNAFGGIGKYSGLILSILGLTNFAGMCFLSMIILYQYCILAVETAQTGKMAGGKMSMWTPLRQISAFSLCVPVAYGLSLIQIFSLGAVGLGINMANIVWEQATTYIVSHVDAGVTDTQSPIIDSEAMQVVQPLFQGVLLQELIKSSRVGTKEYPNKAIREYKEPSIHSQYRKVLLFADYVIEYRPLEGKAYIWLRTAEGSDLGTFGGISVPAPTATLKNGQVVPSGDENTYNAALAITNIRLKELAMMTEALRPWARWYLQNNGITEKDRYQKPDKDGLDLAEQYRENVSKAAAGHLASVAQRGGKKADQLIATALGVRSGQTPDGGWITAGIAPHIISTATDQADILNYGSGVRPVLVDVKAGTYTDDSSAYTTFLGWFTSRTAISETETAALRAAPSFATQVLLRGRAWSGHDQQGEGAGVINQAVTWVFTKDPLNNMGILPTVLRDFSERNPMAAMTTFGDRLLSISSLMFGASAVAGLASVIPGATGALAGLVNNSFFCAIMIALATVGFTFKFIFPTIPLLYWLKAVVAYFALAIEAVVAAPLWLVSFAMPEGEGFVGQHARKGMVQLLDVSIRPVLLVIFLCIFLSIMHCIALIVVAIFTKWINAANSYMSIDLVWQMSIAIIVGSTIYITTVMLCSHMLLTASKSIITWIGGIGSSISSVESSGDRETNVIAGVGAKGAGAMAGVGAGAASLAEKYKKNKENKGDEGGKGGSGGKDNGANLQMKSSDDCE